MHKCDDILLQNIVLVVANQRSGTKALGSALSNIDDIKYFGETFYHDLQSSTSFWKFFCKIFCDRPFALVEGYIEDSLDSYFSKLLHENQNKIIVVDIMYNNLGMLTPMWRDIGREPFILEYAKKRSMRIIHLQRSNLLDCYLSIKIAEASSLYHSTTGELNLDKCISININDLYIYLKLKLHTRKIVKKSLEMYHKSIELEYDQVFNNNMLTEHCASKISSILNISKDALLQIKSVYNKTKLSKKDAISNFEEASLAYTAFMNGFSC